MTRSFPRPRLLAVAVAAVAAPAPALADCDVFSFRTAQPFVERFVMRPNSLLSDFPEGGTGLTSRVLIIAASSRAAMPLVLTVGRSAPAQQQQAVARGLAEAAKACELKAPVEARRIQTAVQKLPDGRFREEFQAHYQSQNDRDAEARRKRLAEDVTRPGLADQRSPLFDPRSTAPIGPLAPIRPPGAVPALAPPR